MRDSPIARESSAVPVPKGRLIAFEGIDGSGKTTTAAALQNEAERRGVPCVLVDKRNQFLVTGNRQPDGIPPYVFDHLRTLIGLIWRRPDRMPWHLLGTAHWIRLVGAYFAALDQAVVAPLTVQGHTVVVDNWYYKFATRIRSMASSFSADLDNVLGAVRRPDIVFLLDVDERVTVRRKKSFTDSELGATSESVRAGSDEHGLFVAHQAEVRRIYEEFAAELGWCRIDPGTRVPHELAADLADRLGWPLASSRKPG